MKFGIAAASLFNRVQTESAFEILRQMRIDITEVFLHTFSEYEKPYVDALAQRRGSIAVHSVHPQGTQFESQLFNGNVRVRADAENLFRKVCYAGYALGAKYYTFYGPMHLNKPNFTLDYVKLGLYDRMNQLIEIAQSYGIKLSYENVHWGYSSTPEFFKQLLSRCPRMHATLSVKQAVMAGIDPIKFMDAMEGHISTVHLCDVAKNGDTTLPGAGKVPFEKIFRELDRRNVNANLFLEAFPRDYKDLNELKSSYDYLAHLLNKVRNK